MAGRGPDSAGASWPSPRRSRDMAAPVRFTCCSAGSADSSLSVHVNLAFRPLSAPQRRQAPTLLCDEPMADNADLIPLIERLQSARVLCIGDVMLDHYVYGQVERVSPEAPIPVLNIERELKTSAAPAMCCAISRHWAQKPRLFRWSAMTMPVARSAVCSKPRTGAEVHVLAQPARTTTVKTRYVAANQQLLRADRETAVPLDPYIREDLLRLARELVSDQSVVIVSDYAKGVLTEGVALEIIRAAREAGAKVIVDPKGGDPIRYRGADLLKAEPPRISARDRNAGRERGRGRRCGAGFDRPLRVSRRPCFARAGGNGSRRAGRLDPFATCGGARSL